MDIFTNLSFRNFFLILLLLIIIKQYKIVISRKYFWCTMDLEVCLKLSGCVCYGADFNEKRLQIPTADRKPASGFEKLTKRILVG